VETDEEREELVETLRYALAGTYELEQELGHGGMAVVFKATEVELRRPVALKVLPPGMLVTKASIERFRREARMAAALDHPNIIPIYRIGQAGGVFYIAMKYVEGRSLHGIIESQGALPLAAVLNAMRAATGALAYAHDRGIVHRDIKGGNILVDQDGRVIVADFGLARATEDLALTATGAVLGTPPFMSPEQWGGENITPQSDQYALGVLAFQMLTSSVPFDTESLADIMRHHFFTLPPEVRSVRADVPEELLAVVNRALAKKPQDRFPTTRDMLVAIEAIPFTESDQRESAEALRQLARGTAIPRVKTGLLPPLPAIGTMELHAQQAQPRPQRRSFSPILASALAGLMVFVVGGVQSLARSSTHEERSEIAGTIPTIAQATVSAAAPVEKPAPPRTAPTSAPVKRDRAAAKSASIQPAGVAPLASAPTAGQLARGKLRVRTLPPIAEVNVDGRAAGVGGLFDYPVDSGKRLLRVSAPGYVSVDTLLDVRPNQTATLTITLRSSDGSP
jgi:serine/threonine protein kinase